jgi:hypothetical protein
VQKVISSASSVPQILAQGPKKSYMAQLGYLEREGFYRSLPKGTNPLASFAVFEALAKGGGDMASPVVAEELLAGWRGEGGVDQFASDLLKATLAKYSAYAVFAFLIALVLDLIVESGINAFAVP